MSENSYEYLLTNAPPWENHPNHSGDHHCTKHSMSYPLPDWVYNDCRSETDFSLSRCGLSLRQCATGDAGSQASDCQGHKVEITKWPRAKMMTASKSHAYFTPEDYLEIERISLIKHEYLQGQIVAMAGASKAHVIITGNISALFVNHLRGTGCISYATNMKVRLPTLNLFYYPDLAITCDDRDRSSDEDFILHPKLIIEVLSNSTEAFDRGDKFADYKSIPEFEEYVLIHQNQILVERFQRKSDNLWTPQIYQTGIVEFTSISFSCVIGTLYENIAQLL